jgi:hypothetical protein
MSGGDIDVGQDVLDASSYKLVTPAGAQPAGGFIRLRNGSIGINKHNGFGKALE